MDTLTLTDVLFYILAAITGFCALAVVVTQNIVRAAAWLLFTLAGVSGLFFLLGADFVGATQLLIYVGGTLVLVVFGVMLTAQGPFINMRIGAAEWAIALAVGLVMYGILAASLMIRNPLTDRSAQASGGTPATGPASGEDREMPDSAILGEALLGQWQASRPGHVSGLQKGVRRNRKEMGYLLPFEIVSVHLLVVLIGAAYLARAKRRRSSLAPASQPPEGIGNGQQQVGATV